MPFVGIVLASTCIFQAIGNGAGALILSAGRQGVIFAIVIICASKIAGFSGVIASPAGFGFPDGACGSDDSAAVEEKSTCRLKILKKAVKRLRSEFPGWEPAAAVFAHAENKTMCPRQKHVKVTKNRHAIRQYYGIAFRENKI